MVHLARVRRQHDRVIRPYHGGVRLEEDQRLRWEFVAHLGHMRGVVPPDAHHLGARDHRRAAAPPQGDALPRGVPRSSNNGSERRTTRVLAVERNSAGREFTHDKTRRTHPWLRLLVALTLRGGPVRVAPRARRRTATARLSAWGGRGGGGSGAASPTPWTADLRDYYGPRQAARTSCAGARGPASRSPTTGPWAGATGRGGRSGWRTASGGGRHAGRPRFHGRPRRGAWGGSCRRPSPRPSSHGRAIPGCLGWHERAMVCTAERAHTPPPAAAARPGRHGRGGRRGAGPLHPPRRLPALHPGRGDRRTTCSRLRALQPTLEELSACSSASNMDCFKYARKLGTSARPGRAAPGHVRTRGPDPPPRHGGLPYDCTLARAGARPGGDGRAGRASHRRGAAVAFGGAGPLTCAVGSLGSPPRPSWVPQ